ncbi:MAG: hypothetical protein ACE5G2_05715 [Candidatus Krumholzibacteriia bacterium]
MRRAGDMLFGPALRQMGAAELLKHTAEVRRDPGQWLPWNYTTPCSEGDEVP